MPALFSFYFQLEPGFISTTVIKFLIIWLLPRAFLMKIYGTHLHRHLCILLIF